MVKTVENIDEYIGQFPDGVQACLQAIRAEVSKVAPNATETIKYGMPTFVLNGNLVYFGAFKKHIGFYPVPQGSNELSEDMRGYKQGRGSIQFPLDKPMPLELVRKLVEWNVKRVGNKKV